MHIRNSGDSLHLLLPQELMHQLISRQVWTARNTISFLLSVCFPMSSCLLIYPSSHPSVLLYVCVCIYHPVCRGVCLARWVDICICSRARLYFCLFRSLVSFHLSVSVSLVGHSLLFLSPLHIPLFRSLFFFLFLIVSLSFRQF